tara:strand:+ start:1784 stop:2623 length:840 start_codon:yes stop_codon:yes gene_type:complete
MGRKIKHKHNKRRNTAFIFEALVRELTKTVINKDDSLKNKIVKVIKEHFKNDTELNKELELYKALRNTYDLKHESAEKLVAEAKKEYNRLNQDKIFNEQSSLIKRINKTLTSDIFSNFVPDYKNLATIYQIFNDKVPVKEKVLLESNLVKRLTSNFKPYEQDQSAKHVDALTLKSFTKRFNTEYGSKMLEEQKRLLNKYIMSFLDNGVELKVHMNEEIGRLKTMIKESLQLDEIKQDKDMLEKTNSVYTLLENFKNANIDGTMLIKVLKIQQLVKEIKE